MKKVKNIRFDIEDIKTVSKLSNNFTEYSNEALKAKIKLDLKHEPRIDIYNIIAGLIDVHGAVMVNDVYGEVLVDLGKGGKE